jgi:hypothetical protein
MWLLACSLSADGEDMTDSRPVFTAHDIPDLFNSLPTMFGFRPAESVVAVATHGPRRRMGFRLRLDLPAAQHVDAAAALIAYHLSRQGAEGAIVLAVTEHQDIARDVLGAVEHHLGDIEPVAVARSDGRRYWVDVPGFPDEGIGYEMSDHHLAIVQAIAEGQQILPDRQALIDRFAPVEGEHRDHMLEVTAAARVRVLGELGRHDESADVIGLRDLDPLLARVDAGGNITDEEAASLSVWVSTIAVRDAWWGRFTEDTAESAFALMARVARVVVPPYEPAVLSLTAFAAWLTGDGAQALIAGERAKAADPDYVMATLVLQILEAGVSPVGFCWTDDLRRAG